MAIGGRELAYLNLSLDLADEAAADGSGPVGAVLVNGHDRVIAQGRNRAREAPIPAERRLGGNSLCHAEMTLFYQFEDTTLCHGSTLITSLEPCVMCAGAAAMLGVKQLIWACNDPWGGASSIIASRRSPMLHSILTTAEPDAQIRRRAVHRFAPEAQRVYPAEGWALWTKEFSTLLRD